MTHRRPRTTAGKTYPRSEVDVGRKRMVVQMYPGAKKKTMTPRQAKLMASRLFRGARYLLQLD